jgi:hypothetical protein
MNSMTRRTLPGPFSTQNLGAGRWRVAYVTPGTWELHLRTEGPDASQILADPSLEKLELNWHGDGVTMVATRGRRLGTLQLANAILHEPLPRLYDALPLARFDARAQRFWKRTFTLMRIPGGRFLLRIMLRRGKKRGSVSR